MQGTATEPKPEQDFQIKNLSPEDRSRFVGAFVWLVQEDKKQNPELYQIKKTEND